MGTRAIYTFIDPNYVDDKFHIYSQYDNYPKGAAELIERALSYSWELPRFEADEFAAAFVAANKPKRGGGIRLCNNENDSYDLDYRYEITTINKDLKITCFTQQPYSSDPEGIDLQWLPIFEGDLDAFKHWGKDN